MKPEERKVLLDREKYPRQQAKLILEASEEAEILRELRFLAGWSTSSDNINSLADKDFNATRAIQKNTGGGCFQLPR